MGVWDVNVASDVMTVPNTLRLRRQTLGFETGTVGSGEKPGQDVPCSRNIRIAGVATLPAQEQPSVSVPPIDKATGGANLTGIVGRHRAERRTSMFALSLKPVQPVPPCPAANRSPHVLREAASHTSFVVQVAQLLYYQKHHWPEHGKDLLCYFIHTLSESPAGTLLTFGAALAAVDALDSGLDVSSKLAAIRGRSQNFQPCVQANVFAFLQFRTGFNLKGKLDVLLCDDVRFEPLACVVPLVVLLVKPDREVNCDLLAYAPKVEPGVKLGRIFGGLKVCNGRGGVYSFSLVNGHNGLLTVTLDRRKNHVDGLARRDLFESHGKPGLREVDNTFQELSFARRHRPETLNEKIDNAAVLCEDCRKRIELALVGKPEAALCGTDDFHVFAFTVETYHPAQGLSMSF